MSRQLGLITNPKNISEVAKLNFYFPENKKEWDQQVTVYICKTWQGEPTETEEMAPRWFKVTEIPFKDMWSDDKYWLPDVLSGNYVEADFQFDDNDELVKKSVKAKKD